MTVAPGVAGTVTALWVYQSRQTVAPRPGKMPATEDTFGSRTGVIRMSRPMRNWVSIPKSSGSSGNSKKSARTGGVPRVDAFAKRVYCWSHASRRQH